MVEQWTENPCVPGSIPGGTTLKIPDPLYKKASGIFHFELVRFVYDNFIVIYFPIFFKNFYSQS